MCVSGGGGGGFFVNLMTLRDLLCPYVIASKLQLSYISPLLAFKEQKEK